jgi:hypothetical protein
MPRVCRGLRLSGRWRHAFKRDRRLVATEPVGPEKGQQDCSRRPFFHRARRLMPPPNALHRQMRQQEQKNGSPERASDAGSVHVSRSEPPRRRLATQALLQDPLARVQCWSMRKHSISLGATSLAGVVCVVEVTNQLAKRRGQIRQGMSLIGGARIEQVVERCNSAVVVLFGTDGAKRNMLRDGLEVSGQVISCLATNHGLSYSLRVKTCRTNNIWRLKWIDEITRDLFPPTSET